MKRLTSKIDIKLEFTKSGYSAYCLDYNVTTTASNKNELINNLIEAINFYLEDEDRYVTIENLNIEIDFNQFFGYFSYLKTKEIAAKIGMNSSLLTQYIRGVKTPSKKQAEKIINGIRTIGKELSQIEL